MVLLSEVLLMGSTSVQYWSLRKGLLGLWPSVIPLLFHYLYFLIFRFLNLMIYFIFNVLLLFMNVITNLLQTILVIILLRYLIFIITILGVLPMVTFFLREKTLYSMVYALCVLMELKFGITSLLISETLHQLQTSRKKSKNCFWSLITQQFDYACSLWYSLSWTENQCAMGTLPFSANGSSRL